MVLPLARSFFVLPGLARTATGCVNEGQTWYEKLYTAIRWIEMPAEDGRFILQFALGPFGISCSLPFGREVPLAPAQLLRLADFVRCTLAENHRIGENRPPEPPLAGRPRLWISDSSYSEQTLSAEYRRGPRLALRLPRKLQV